MTLRNSGEKLDASHVEFTPGVQKDSFLPESYRIQVRSDQFLHWDLGTPQFEANALFSLVPLQVRTQKGRGAHTGHHPQMRESLVKNWRHGSQGSPEARKKKKKKKLCNAVLHFLTINVRVSVCLGGGCQHTDPP